MKFSTTDKSLGTEVEPSQGLQNFSNDNVSTQCPSCGFNKVLVVPMPDGSVHHAALRCGRCNRFIKWQLKPKSQESWKRQQTAIDQLLKSFELSDWEYQFLTSVQGKRSLSPKQQETLSRIEAKVRGLF